jgi:C1A family cysteine protease
VAMGYNDSIEITGEDGKKTKGAIRIRNSWGHEWGEEGYGWLPYEYVLNGLTKDWWSIIKNEWIDNKVFE